MASQDADRPMNEVVGTNIRRLRTAQGLSLSALSRRSGVAKATLSALESNRGNPTVSTLQSLGEALRVTAADLVAAAEHAVTRLLRGSAAAEPGTDDVLVDAFVPGGAVEIYDLRYEPGAELVYAAHQAGTVERVLILEGRLLVGPEDDPTELEEGDLLVFPADRPHRYEAVVGTVRGVLIVSYPATAPAETPIHLQSRLEP